MSVERRMTQLVKVWLEGTSESPYGVEPGVRQVMARVRHTRQRGRWWPLPTFRRTARAPSPTETSDFRASPIPAANGHTPTIAGRTQSMFSPAKAVTAGALIFAIGGALLMAQPFGQQQASAPGAEGDAVPTDPVWVSGTLHLAPHCAGPDIERTDSVQHQRGYRCTPQQWRVDDPRLSGAATSTWNADVYQPDGEGYVSIIAGTYELVNDQGRWHCRYDDALAHGMGLLWDADNDQTVTCRGEDGYEGLSAILITDWAAAPRTIEGLLFEGEGPPLPEFVEE